MAWPPIIPSTYYSFILFVLLLDFGCRSCYGVGLQFGFDVHHRYSPPVKGILGVEGLPEKGSVEYYVAMANRDRMIRGRHLAASNDKSSPLTFSDGNDTYLLAPLGQLGFDVHHRYSPPVKGILGVEGLPEKGSVEYYVAMANRDRMIRGRHLAASNDKSSPLTFSDGNDTYLLAPLGHLHYASVSVGTPSLSFLVALDTGSDLLWLPCDCKKGGCLSSFQLSSGQVFLLNIYSPNKSSTSELVSCNNSFCKPRQCPSASSDCAYKVEYLSNNTSSTGILVEDVLHLITDDDQLRAVTTPITFGCGQSQTGSFLEGGAPNGLFGLGVEDISVPSTLARNGLALNSFSMCFGPDGLGRITFGNNGSSDQKETPFNVKQSHPTYNISITQITVGRNSSDLGLNVIFDSGTSFTSLTDPAYTFISESFNSQVQENRHSSDSLIPFEYCYDFSPTQDRYEGPVVNLTMKGGDHYFITNPTHLVYIEGEYVVYCLGLLKTEKINIIGQNFMTGYHIVFDRQRMVLGWKDSNCYNDRNSNTLAVSPSHSPAASPSLAVNPEATNKSGSSSSIPVAAPSSHSPKLKYFTYALTVLLVLYFAIV